MKYRTHIWLFFRTDIFLIIRTAQKCQHHTISAKRRFNNIWDVFLLRLVIKIGQILTRYILMLCQVIIRTVRDTPQLAPAKWEEKFHIGRCFTVK